MLLDEISNDFVIPNGTIGSRWDQGQKWNLELKDAVSGKDIHPRLSVHGDHDEIIDLAFPYFGGETYKHEHFNASKHDEIITREVAVKKHPEDAFLYCTVFDLMVANYGIARGIEDDNAATAYEQDLPYTPAWQEQITGVPAEQVITTARQSADNAA